MRRFAVAAATAVCGTGKFVVDILIHKHRPA